MIEIGSFRSRDCHGITRRSFVQAATSVPLALGLGGLATRDARAWTPTEGRARSVLMVWLWGGPAQQSTTPSDRSGRGGTTEQAAAPRPGPNPRQTSPQRIS